MTRYKIIIFYLIFVKLFESNGKAQIFVDHLRIPSRISDFDVDLEGNIYTVDKNKILFFDSNEVWKTTYEFKNWIEVSSIDISETNSILCFNKDLSEFYFIDNQLNQISEPIELGSIGLFEIANIQKASNNCFSLFNKQTLKLEIYDHFSNKLQESLNLDAISEIDLNLLCFKSYKDGFYLQVNSRNILQLDKQCVFIRKIELSNIQNFAVEGDLLIYFDGENFFFTNKTNPNFKELSITTPIHKIRKMCIKNKIIYLLLDDGIHTLDIKK